VHNSTHSRSIHSTANFDPYREFCAITLEKNHKLRLIGTEDSNTLAAFEDSVKHYWWQDVAETNRLEGDGGLQIKVVGNAWNSTTTIDNIRSARLICGVLQTLWCLGWRWHCAVDLSTLLSDKSSFFLSRPMKNSSTTQDNEDDDNHYDGLSSRGRIGCIQPKGSGKINLVGFPTSCLDKTIREINSASKNWPYKVDRIEKLKEPDIGSAKIQFACLDMHETYTTDEKARTMRIYNELLHLVAKSGEGVTLLGTGDISGNCHSGRDKAYSMDTDVFFLWFPKDTHANDKDDETFLDDSGRIQFRQ